MSRPASDVSNCPGAHRPNFHDGPPPTPATNFSQQGSALYPNPPTISGNSGVATAPIKPGRTGTCLRILCALILIGFFAVGCLAYAVF